MSGGLISATFVEQGTLGLKFAPLERASQVGVQILSINPGTQAEHHRELRTVDHARPHRQDLGSSGAFSQGSTGVGRRSEYAIYTEGA